MNYTSLKKKQEIRNTLQVCSYNRVSSFYGTDVPVVGFYKGSLIKIHNNLQLGLLKSTILKAELKTSNYSSIARIPIIFLEGQSLLSSFSSHMSCSTLIIFFCNVTNVRIPPPHETNRNNPPFTVLRKMWTTP